MFSYIPGVGAIIGAWLGALVIPLDWDRPWQVWPVSCVYGAGLGYVLTLMGTWLSLGYFGGLGKDFYRYLVSISAKNVVRKRK